MNDRVKELRNTLGLSGEKFGARIGIKRAAISKIENSITGLSDQNILAICREFNVNEEWLRYGKGDMFSAIEKLPLDELLSDVSPLELDILKAYFTLDKDIRQKAIAHFQNCLRITKKHTP